jgi:predicted nucleic acid-binding protein
LKVLLDTNVLSEVRRPRGNALVRERIATTPEEDQFVSVISIGEIAYGTARLEPGKRRRELEEWLERAERHFAHHILPIDREIAHLWGDLTARAARVDRTLHTADGLIAATALHHGLRLMTRNVTDFEPTGVLLIDPWSDSSS